MKADQYPYHNSYVVILCLYVMPRPCLVLEVCVEGEGGLVYLSVSQNDLCLWVCGPWVSWTEVFKSNACGGLCLVWGYHGYIWGKWLVYQYSICHLSEYFQNQWSNKFDWWSSGLNLLYPHDYNTISHPRPIIRSSDGLTAKVQWLLR